MSRWVLTAAVLLLSHTTHALSLKNFREIESSLSVATEIPTSLVASTAFKVRPRLPQSGKLIEYTPSAQIGLITLSSTYCEARVEKDKALSALDRVLFREIEFSHAGLAISPVDLAPLLDRLASRFWQRRVTREESAMFHEYVTALAKSGLGLTQSLVVLCTLFGSSFEFILYS